jgi:hypothetical protein
MKPELFEKLGRLKTLLAQMDITSRVAFAERVRSKLPPEALVMTDGEPFSIENLLGVGLAAPVVSTREEFCHMVGLYEGGYRSELRRLVYHGCVGSENWSKEIRRLYHNVRAHAMDVIPPELLDTVEIQSEQVPERRPQRQLAREMASFASPEETWKESAAPAVAAPMTVPAAD